jgi:GNAT superfamily N-acetyltransferase
MADLSWATGEELIAAADFLTEAIRRDDSYVSHGEVQTGLSPDGVHWADDLATLMREDLADPGPDRQVLVARESGRILGAAIVLWVETVRVRYMVIEDVAVAPETRGTGLGGRVLAFLEAAGAERGIGWAFLESGLRNHGAHDFFEHRGFAAISKVFCKRLTP